MMKVQKITIIVCVICTVLFSVIYMYSFTNFVEGNKNHNLKVIIRKYEFFIKNKRFGNPEEIVITLKKIYKNNDLKECIMMLGEDLKTINYINAKYYNYESWKELIIVENTTQYIKKLNKTAEKIEFNFKQIERSSGKLDGKVYLYAKRIFSYRIIMNDWTIYYNKDSLEIENYEEGSSLAP